MKTGEMSINHVPHLGACVYVHKEQNMFPGGRLTEQLKFPTKKATKESQQKQTPTTCGLE